MTFPVLLDTCALFGITLSDLILRLAERGTFRPLWSETILQELHRNLVSQRGLSQEQASRRVDAMREYFPDAIVYGFEQLQETLTCDRKDAHVLAAGIRANAAVLVTFNLKDFPASSVEPFDIVAIHLDHFLLDQLDLFEEEVMAALEEMVSHYDSPPITLPTLLEGLKKAGVPEFTEAVQEVVNRYDSSPEHPHDH